MIRIGETDLSIGGRSDFALVGEDPEWARLNVSKKVHGQILGRTPVKGDPNYILELPRFG